MININELRQLVQAATPGPWFSDRRGNIWRRPLSDLYENGGGVAGDKPLAFVAAGWAGEGVTGYPVEANARFIAAANPAVISELLDRLEAAESDAAHQKALAASALRVAEGWERKCGELRAKIEAMEKQEPARLVTPTAYRWRYRGAVMWQYGELTEETVRLAKEHNHEVQPLYLATGAKGEEK